MVSWNIFIKTLIFKILFNFLILNYILLALNFLLQDFSSSKIMRSKWIHYILVIICWNLPLKIVSSESVQLLTQRYLLFICFECSCSERSFFSLIDLWGSRLLVSIFYIWGNHSLISFICQWFIEFSVQTLG